MKTIGSGTGMTNSRVVSQPTAERQLRAVPEVPEEQRQNTNDLAALGCVCLTVTALQEIQQCGTITVGDPRSSSSWPPSKMQSWSQRLDQLLSNFHYIHNSETVETFDYLERDVAAATVCRHSFQFPSLKVIVSRLSALV